MAPSTLTLRDLNRALLARQLLLERVSLPATDALERVAGVQAQATIPPFVGLWTRLSGFDDAELAIAIDDRSVVRATMMRHTIHFVTARDYLRLRNSIHSGLVRSWTGQTSKRLDGFDVQPAFAAARERFAAGPATFAEVKEDLRARWPDADIDAIGYGVRTHIRLVGVPNATRWRFGGRAPFVLAEDWLGREPDPEPDAQELARRYLAAFGPATPADATNWSGVAGMRQVFESMRGELRVFRDERGRELFDVEDAPLPGGGEPAPVRLLPEYDNTLLGHDDRTRVVADEHRPRLYLIAGRVMGAFLLDGFTAGTWKVVRERGSATLEVEPFARVKKKDQAELRREAEALLAFTDPDASDHDVRFADPA